MKIEHFEIFACKYPGSSVLPKSEAAVARVWDCGETFSYEPNHEFPRAPVCAPGSAVQFIGGMTGESPTVRVPVSTGYPVGPKHGFDYLVFELHMLGLASSYEGGRIGNKAKILLPDDDREPIPVLKRPKSLLLLANGLNELNDTSVIISSYVIPTPMDVYSMYLHAHPFLIEEQIWVKKAANHNQGHGNLILKSNNSTTGMTDEHDFHTNLNIRLEEGDVLTLQCMYNNANPMHME